MFYAMMRSYKVTNNVNGSCDDAILQSYQERKCFMRGQLFLDDIAYIGSTNIYFNKFANNGIIASQHNF